MRLVRNPSYKHGLEIVKKFNLNKDSIYYKDHTQYTPEMIDTLLFSLDEASRLKIKAEHKLWLSKQLWNDKIDSQKRAEEDYLPLVKIQFANQSLLNPISSYSSISELNEAINNLSEDEVVSEKEYDVFYERDGWFIAMPHTTQASCMLGKQTDWCTARTKSQNLFLSYVGRYEDDIVLFYVIKINGNTKSNPNDKLSVGFENNIPIFDGQNGGLSVNAINKGITLKQFGEILGKKLAKEFLVKMDEKTQSIKGKHPAKKEMERIAKSTDKYLKKVSEFKNEEHLRDFKREIVKYPVSEEVQLLLIENTDNWAKETLASNPSLTEKVQTLLAKDMSEGVRLFLALNPNITENVQLILTKDTEYWIRLNLASNPNITEKVQLILTEDTSKSVRKSLLKNKSVNKRIRYLTRMYGV